MEHIKVTFTLQNLILFILAISLINGAFKDYNTIDDIFNERASRYNRLILEWVDYMLHVLIIKGLTLASPFRMI
jgi:hypothetical protein